jgi:hypothetical protein
MGPYSRSQQCRRQRSFKKNADEGLRLARKINQVRTKLALIEMATEFRVMAQHLVAREELFLTGD